MININNVVKRMRSRKIQPVQSNLDKQRTYAKQKKQYGLAIKYGFCFEAIMIDYSMIEDRLRSMLYHMGFLQDRNAIIIRRSTRPYLIDIVERYKSTDSRESASLGISNISGKVKILRTVLLWVSQTSVGYEDNVHLKSLKYQCESLDIDALISAFDELIEWCEYRNEIVHALMNKNLESLNKELLARAESGMKLAECFDAQVEILKKGNYIRKKINLPLN